MIGVVSSCVIPTPEAAVVALVASAKVVPLIELTVVCSQSAAVFEGAVLGISQKAAAT